MKCICLLLLLLHHLISYAQEEPTEATTEQQLESQSENTETENEDDSFLQHWQYLKEHPLNLNAATENDLQELHLLNDLQITAFINYRNRLGKLISLYEIQAIPTWDIATIKKLQPFISIAETGSYLARIRNRWTGGDKNLLLRSTGIMEKSKGFLKTAADSSSHYLGSPAKLLVRYKYNYKNLLQWGILGEKDPGEQFFKAAQKYGFDFYSFHLFVRNVGIVKSLALGDYTVSMGQGLIQWQSMAFNKGANVLATKRQSPVLRPYNSAGEFNFHRGAGITLQKGNWETTAFISLRKLTANFEADTSLDGHVSSLSTSGYHRTANEISDRNNLTQLTGGGNLQYSAGKWKIGLNGIHYHFSLPIQKKEAPYNLFALKGNSLTNYSMDYSYTRKNIHFFGEIAIDNNMHTAFLNGLLISMSQFADASLVHRKIDRAFQSLYANAFIENTNPNNESGLYGGISLHPAGRIQIDAYADIFRFPWLKYLVDAPSYGREYFIQLTYKPNKQTEIYTRFRNKAKQEDLSNTDLPTKIVDMITHKNWRINASFKLSTTVTLRSRYEMLWYDKNGPHAEEGYASMTDIFYKPNNKPWSCNLRLQYFETNGYNSRIYAFENDILYGSSIPAVFGEGMRYYINGKIDISRLLPSLKHKKWGIDLYARWSRTMYDKAKTIGSGLDEIDGRKKSDFKCEFLIHL
jgi:hypothetical protein